MSFFLYDPEIPTSVALTNSTFIPIYILKIFTDRHLLKIIKQFIFDQKVFFLFFLPKSALHDAGHLW